MTASNLRAAHTKLVSVFEAATPPTDGSGASYAFVNTFIEERGGGQHRQLSLHRPSLATVVAEAAIQLEWTFAIDLFVHRNDRAQEEFNLAISDEVVTLVLAWTGITNWGNANVLEVHLDDVAVDDVDAPAAPRAGVVAEPLVCKASFNFRALIQES